MMKIGTSGFRGIIGEEFTRENVEKIVQCICEITNKQNKQRKIVVGYDNRFMSETFAKWVCEVLAGNNIVAILTKTSVPSPLLSFAVKSQCLDFGIMITASHNPYFFNGLKVYTKEGKEPNKELEEILNKRPQKVKKILKKDFEIAKKENLIELKGFEQEYIKSIIKLLKFKNKFKKKVAFNVMNGSSFCAVQELKKQLKIENLDLFNTNRDISFGFKAPNPFIVDYVKEFKDMSLKENYDFAFATDGDGDRIAVFDEKGTYHDGNEISSLLYYFALKEKKQKGAFVKNYSFSTMIDGVAKKFGEQVFETKVGFKNITESLVKNNALFGAENSGCEVNGHVFVKDGLVVFVLILEILEYYDKPLSQIFEQLRKELNFNLVYVEHSIVCNKKDKLINYLKKNSPCYNKKIMSIGTLDGFKYYFEDGTWVLIRFSGTEDVLRIVSEQESKKQIDKIIEEIEALIKVI